MKLTKTQLRSVIKETLSEAVAHPTLWLHSVIADITKTLNHSPQISENPEHVEKLNNAMRLIAEVRDALHDERQSKSRWDD